MNVLKRAAALVLRPDSGDDALAAAEALGEVSINEWFGSRRATIEIGSFSEVYLRVNATAETSTEALHLVTKKTQALLAAFTQSGESL